MITVDNVWKEYGDQIVLERISLSIEDRAFVALVGPSGCGKTTFLKLLLGEERPSQGSITLDGRPLSAEPGPDRGVVFQRYSVFPHLTVLGNVLLGKEFEASRFRARLVGPARRNAIDEARALIAEVGLEASENKYPAQLSGGMQQRLALAQALIMRPRVLLLDEPFGALDPVTRDKLQQSFLAIRRRLNLTAIFVTHDMIEALLIADRVAVMKDGDLVQVGTPRELLDAPASDYVEQLFEMPRRQARILSELSGETETEQADGRARSAERP